jgi:uncharacterized 2Fe-2S/4Fe-4S cluster protein (DUF4445 family)
MNNTKGQADQSGCPFLHSKKCDGCGACAKREVLTEYTAVREVALDRGLEHGLGMAIDIGTTTIAAEMMGMRSGQRISVASCVNPQMRYGADVIRRVEYARTHAGELRRVLVEEIRGLERKLTSGLDKATHAVIVGNTVMIHLLRGWPVDGLATWPFEPFSLEGGMVEGILKKPVYIPPAVSPFFGADAVAGLVHCGHGLFLDMGTNAEIALYSEDGIYTTSAAAGAAFSSDKRLALAAIHAAVEIIAREGGKPAQVFTAGGIGNAIGFPDAKPVGNAALGGCRAILLSAAAQAEAEAIARLAKSIDLAGRADFAELYIQHI